VKVHVLDASVLVEILLQTPLGIRHTDRVLDRNESLHVPHLLDLEVLQAVRRLTLAGEITTERAEIALVALLDLQFTRHEHTLFIGRIWELRASMTAYDAAYVALAEGLSAVLLTCDSKLARAHGHHASIDLLT
jgi:predicted nucleic acid-binding protein